jgi:uncharacterized protein YabN with tetrapyrrole methylase and pyrophosphatase domain
MTKLQKIAKHNGEEFIKAKAIEELNELIEAIEENDIHHIIEEIADTEIMCHQLRIALNVNEDVDDVIAFKLDRTLRRLGVK